MDHSPDQIEQQVVAIIRERDHLRIDNQLSKMAIVELENQIMELDRLLTNSQALVRGMQQYTGTFLSNASAESVNLSPRTSRTKTSFLAAGKKSFIGPWECSPLEFPLLAPIEDLFRNGQRQKALNQMPQLLMRRDLDSRYRVNTKLLFAALIQSSGQNLMTALRLTEEALCLASEVKLIELAGKANYWRGLVFLCLEEWANAKWCFVLSSHLQGHSDLIEEGRNVVEKELSKLPKHQKVVTDDFKFFCSATMEAYVKEIEP